MKRAVIYFKDGTTDFVDPVEEEDVHFTETSLIVSNGAHEYSYDLSEIANVQIIELPEEQK